MSEFMEIFLDAMGIDPSLIADTPNRHLTATAVEAQIREDWERIRTNVIAQSIRSSYGQPMLTVKDDDEDHEAAILDLKLCIEAADDRRFASLRDHFNRRNLR